MNTNIHIHFIVTKRCNRSCAGCYSSYAYDRWGLDKKELTTVMSPDIAEKGANWVAHLLKHWDVAHDEPDVLVRVGFMGGEPLLQPDLVFKISDIIRQTTSPHFNIYTNADKFSQEILSEAKSRRIMFTINPADDPIEVVEKKLKLAKSICGGCSMTMALNSFNLERIEELVKLGIRSDSHMRINKLHQGPSLPGYIDEYERQMSKGLKLLIEADVPIWPNFLLHCVFPLRGLYSKKRGFIETDYTCRCGSALFIVDPDGSVRSCLADPTSKVGDIDAQWLGLNSYVTPQEYIAKDIPECEKCEWAWLCRGVTKICILSLWN